LKISTIQKQLNRFFLVSVISMNVFFISSCKKYNQATPAFFMKANNFSVTTTSVQGSSSSNISELFLYVNGKFQGAYPKGSLMPIANNNQNVTIEVLAGIKNNGLKATHITWLFYDKIKVDTIVPSGKIIERPFVFKYNPDVKFPLVEGFENNGYGIINSAASSSTFAIAAPSESFEGKSIKLQLTNIKTIAQVESALFYSLPKGSPNVYLELDYKCFQEFTIGVIDNTSTTEKQVITINPSPTWNKIYINLAEAVNLSSSASTYKIYFKMVKISDSDDSRVFLDNIKLIHF
jgi:hypothetical protein